MEIVLQKEEKMDYDLGVKVRSVMLGVTKRLLIQSAPGFVKNHSVWLQAEVRVHLATGVQGYIKAPLTLRLRSPTTRIPRHWPL